MDKERKKIKSEAEKEDAGETNRKVNERERETNDKWINEIQVYGKEKYHTKVVIQKNWYTESLIKG